MGAPAIIGARRFIDFQDRRTRPLGNPEPTVIAGLYARAFAVAMLPPHFGQRAEATPGPRSPRTCTHVSAAMQRSAADALDAATPYPVRAAIGSAPTPNPNPYRD